MSDDEGFGLPIIEALGSNTPIVCRNTEINRELLENAAIIIEPSEMEKAVTQVIRMLEDSATLENLKYNMHLKRSAYDSSIALKEYISLYKEIYKNFP